jgi:branched-chain amino acid transport system substrate-binding protein
MKKYFLLLISIFLISACSDTPNDCDIYDVDDINEVKICGVFSLTENLVDLGTDSKAAMELAVEDFKVMLARNSINYTVDYVIEDSKLNPDIAKEIVEARFKEGYRIFIGPSSSSEILKIKSFYTANDALIISHYSTAGSLAADDNLFRYCPPDKLESLAMSKYLVKQKKKAVVTLYRNDVGNKGLYDAFKTYFTADGGKMYNPISFEPATTDYAQTIINLRNTLIQALDENPTEDVAVYYAGFSECKQILELASQDEVFSTVQWYCGDGITMNNAIFESPNASSFAKKVGLTSPTVGLDYSANSIYEPLIERILAKTGKTSVNNYALGVYDATWNALTAKLSVRANKFSQLRNQFIANSNSYFGTSGYTKLDNFGDRQYSTFDFWYVTGEPANWFQTASYNILKDSWDFVSHQGIK